VHNACTSSSSHHTLLQQQNHLTKQKKRTTTLTFGAPCPTKAIGKTPIFFTKDLIFKCSNVACTQPMHLFPTHTSPLATTTQNQTKQDFQKNYNTYLCKSNNKKTILKKKSKQNLLLTITTYLACSQALHPLQTTFFRKK
jgi:hypothetical protein